MCVHNHNYINICKYDDPYMYTYYLCVFIRFCYRNDLILTKTIRTRTAYYDEAYTTSCGWHWRRRCRRIRYEICVCTAFKFITIQYNYSVTYGDYLLQLHNFILIMHK